MDPDNDMDNMREVAFTMMDTSKACEEGKMDFESDEEKKSEQQQQKEQTKERNKAERQIIAEDEVEEVDNFNDPNNCCQPLMESSDNSAEETLKSVLLV